MTSADALELELRREIDDLKRQIAAVEADLQRRDIAKLRRRPPLRIALKAPALAAPSSPRTPQ